MAIIERGKPIDLLFTDVVMPGGMTGIELATKVRECRPGLKIVFTSGFAAFDKLRQDTLGVDARWLGKPHGVNELQAALRELLDR